MDERDNVDNGGAGSAESSKRRRRSRATILPGAMCCAALRVCVFACVFLPLAELESKSATH